MDRIVHGKTQDTVAGIGNAAASIQPLLGVPLVERIRKVSPHGAGRIVAGVFGRHTAVTPAMVPVGVEVDDGLVALTAVTAPGTPHFVVDGAHAVLLADLGNVPILVDFATIIHDAGIGGGKADLRPEGVSKVSGCVRRPANVTGHVHAQGLTAVCGNASRGEGGRGLKYVPTGAQTLGRRIAVIAAGSLARLECGPN